MFYFVILSPSFFLSNPFLHGFCILCSMLIISRMPFGHSRYSIASLPFKLASLAAT
ncbi:hypothetical protein BX661DRAFT_181460 [Kickxella alabastrina]|uniref:uncharacterized protein n=1 Tax=Kickxella alabastrina TaxID=61397 RepID=UPI00221F880C|nr:uncharacterized protein BX661DRAFT_181460 [Kickxella alabastrina]KAI7829155.1 hypothetical protein BX661DRAFT_181460 [Kickxella alabastrina]